MRYTTRTTRIEALDIFRALTMFLMLFVNDIPGLKNIPHWLLHAKVDEDMLGFSDIIFPAFLFAMGMAVPFAILNRENKGDSTLEVIGYILVRTFALLIMGVYTVNRDTFDGTATGLPFAWFSILMVVAFFLIWNVYPAKKGRAKYLIRGCQLAGVGILVYLFYIYKGVGNSSFSPQWWGILGLIGWVYLATSVLFLLFRQVLVLQLLAFLLICSYCICSFMGIVPDCKFIGWLPTQSALYGFGSAGLVAGLLLKQIARKHFRTYTITMFVLGIASLIAGIVSHQYWIISKIQGTPTWLFYCCAIFFPLFILVYWITDVKGQSRWFLPVKPAGTVTLTCYIIPYAWYSVESLLHVSYPAAWLAGIPGLIKSVVFSLLVIWLAGLFKLVGVRLKI